MAVEDGVNGELRRKSWQVRRLAAKTTEGRMERERVEKERRSREGNRVEKVRRREKERRSREGNTE